MTKNVRRYKPYPRYKRSAIEWLGSIPAHWGLKRLKVVAPARVTKCETKPEDSLYVGLEHIEPWTGRLLLDNQPEAVDSTVSSFRSGDVLLGKLRPYLAKVARPNFHGVCTSEILPLRPAIDCHQSFLAYFLLNAPFVHWLDSLTYGTKMPRVSPAQVASSAIAVPPEPEQRAIAAFLDSETARIDMLVAKKEQLIELLLEKRTSLITRAVTKGLDPTTSMKNSDIDWLGQIPAHWDLRPLKRYLRAPLAYGVLKPDRYQGEGGVRLIRILDVESGQVSEDALERISPQQSEEYRRTIVKAGDLVVSVVGTIGRAFVVPKSLEGANLSRALARIQLRPILLNRFLEYGFAATPFVSFVELVPAGTAQRVLNLGDLAQYRLPVPAVSEQEAIIEFLDDWTVKIDSLVAKTKEAINCLKELRISIISAAVTGKIDTREDGA